MTAQVIPLRPRRARRRTTSLNGRLLAIAVPVVLATVWLLALPGMPHAPSGAAAAEEYRQDFAIPAGSLRPALEKYARQAGIRLSFDPAQVAGLTTGGLKGRYTAQAGLDALLRGTGYVGAQSHGRYVLIPDPQLVDDEPAPAGPQLAGGFVPA